ncbi:unnamed protein product [Candida verbasci]|uniref:histone acetyltransferase n=1 Tax=Candida verbasci TaxID=1227364 RepID=A0A9W4X8Z8_9ASCO|nr:unnamed protein product [Candida verbasci]
MSLIETQTNNEEQNGNSNSNGKALVSSTKELKIKEPSFYGVLNKPNIEFVYFGNYKISPWYGNAAYFYPQDLSHNLLGYEYANKVALDPLARKRNKETDNQEINTNVIWLENLFVCPFCFKYTANQHEGNQHQVLCKCNKYRPNIGKLVYYDSTSNYIIREIRGFQHPLYCQNLCLFGKLFLDDKSIYYNIDHFNFYVIYGMESDKYIPMGFFSKEMLSYDVENNLACICIFPPFQRKKLGTLLIEFSYELAKFTPGQYRSSGPEFPLSPFGQISYLSYWSKKIANVIYKMKNKKSITVAEVMKYTGFRKEDVLLTLENMKILVQEDLDSSVLLSIKNFENWCQLNNLDPSIEVKYLNEECILI